MGSTGEFSLRMLEADGFVDLTLRCPTCGSRADMCFAHGDDWKKCPMPPRYLQTDAQLRAGVNEFTEDDPPPYAMSATSSPHHPHGPEDPRFLDEDGRCLLCGLLVKHDRERVALEVEARAIAEMEAATDPGDVAAYRSVLAGIRDYDARDPDARLPAVWDLNWNLRIL